MIDKKRCFLSPEYIIEVNDDKNNKFMIGVACFEHKIRLEEKFLALQREKRLPSGKLEFTHIKTVHTTCIKGTQDDVDEIQIRRL